MELERMNRWLLIAGIVLGVVVIIYGFLRYFRDGSVPSGLIALAVVIVGPLEDYLKKQVRLRRNLPPQEPAVQFVDLTTSVTFLILLLFAIRAM